MPRTLALTHYPIDAYKALFNAVKPGGEAIILPPLEGISALSLRGKLYAFRRACQRNKEEAKMRGVDVDAMMEVNISVTEDGRLCLQHRRDTPEAKALLEALNQLGLGESAQQAQEANEMLKRLMGGS